MGTVQFRTPSCLLAARIPIPFETPASFWNYANVPVGERDVMFVTPDRDDGNVLRLTCSLCLDCEDTNPTSRFGWTRR